MHRWEKYVKLMADYVNKEKKIKRLSEFMSPYTEKFTLFIE